MRVAASHNEKRPSRGGESLNLHNRLVAQAVRNLNATFLYSPRDVGCKADDSTHVTDRRISCLVGAAFADIARDV